MHWNYINHNCNTHDYCEIYEEGPEQYYENSNKNSINDFGIQYIPEAHFACDVEVRDYDDPWEYYYQQLEMQHNEARNNNNCQQTVDNAVDRNYKEPSANIGNEIYLGTDTDLSTLTNTDRHNDDNHYNNHTVNEINSCEIVQNQTEEYSSNNVIHNSSVIEITSMNMLEDDDEEDEEEIEKVNNVQMDRKQEHVTEVIKANEQYMKTQVYHCPKTTNFTNITATTTTTTEPTTTSSQAEEEDITTATSIDDETIERDINIDTYIVTNHRTQQIREEDVHKKKKNTQNVVEEVKGISYWCRHYSGNILHIIILCVCMCVCVCLYVEFLTNFLQPLQMNLYNKNSDTSLLLSLQSNIP